MRAIVIRSAGQRSEHVARAHAPAALQPGHCAAERHPLEAGVRDRLRRGASWASSMAGSSWAGRSPSWSLPIEATARCALHLRLGTRALSEGAAGADPGRDGTDLPRGRRRHPVERGAAQRRARRTRSLARGVRARGQRGGDRAAARRRAVEAATSASGCRSMPSLRSPSAFRRRPAAAWSRLCRTCRTSCASAWRSPSAARRWRQKRACRR